MSTDRWMYKQNVIYTQHKISFNLFKKKGILPHGAMWMILEDIMLNEISHRHKYYMIPLTMETK